MFTGRLVVLALFSISLHAQLAPIGESIPVTGEVRCDGVLAVNGFEVQLYDPKNHTVIDRTIAQSDGRFQLRGAIPGTFIVRVLMGPSGDPVLEETRQIDHLTSPLILQVQVRPSNRPVSGTVSLSDLQHPISKKALHAAIEAQHYSQAHGEVQAMAKLEEAIRIDPGYRDAHTNLGALYARAGRIQDAMTQFQQAMQIGPPSSIVYSNVSWAHLALKQPREAEEFARKALALDPTNTKALYLLNTITGTNH